MQFSLRQIFPLQSNRTATDYNCRRFAKGKTDSVATQPTVIGAFGEDLILHDALNRCENGPLLAWWMVNAIVARLVSMDAICGSKRWGEEGSTKKKCHRFASSFAAGLETGAEEN